MSDISVNAFLEHHGVKGMKWGIRNDRVSGTNKHVEKHAKKDAAEYARAKAFFGEGAGTRRKLIKQTVESKSKNMPGYKEAFDRHLSTQDQAQHVTKAKRERKRKDTVDTNKKRISAVARRITNEPGTQAAFVALILGGAAYLHSDKGKAKMKASIRAAKHVPDNVKRFINARRLKKFLGSSTGNSEISNEVKDLVKNMTENSFKDSNHVLDNSMTKELNKYLGKFGK